MFFADRFYNRVVITAKTVMCYLTNPNSCIAFTCPRPVADNLSRVWLTSRNSPPRTCRMIACWCGAAVWKSAISSSARAGATTGTGTSGGHSGVDQARPLMRSPKMLSSRTRTCGNRRWAAYGVQDSSRRLTTWSPMTIIFRSDWIANQMSRCANGFAQPLIRSADARRYS